MSGFSSLLIGVGGLQAQSSALGIISDNLANISAVGYKKSGALFQTLLGNDNANTYMPGGAKSITRKLNHSQGILFGTVSTTDIAISGTGFFAVRQTTAATSDVLYTRAGDFVPNADGDFINSAGYFLQGWLLDDEQVPSGLADDLVDGDTGIASLQTINIASFTDDAVPTTEVIVQASLKASQSNYSGSPAYNAASSLANMSDGAVSPSFSKPLTFVDSEGNEHSVTIGFLKTAANTWAVEIYATTASELSGATAQLAAGTVTFNGDGTLASVSAGLTSAISASWTDPDTASNSVTFNWGTAGALGTGLSDGLSQLDAPYKSTVEQNGFTAGSLNGITITSEGFVFGNYEEGKSRALFQIPLAIFTEQNQLQSLTGNIYTQSPLSGDVNFVHPGTGGFGTLFSKALEGSNVDTGSQLTDMIVAQRAYQFNTRIISTSDENLEKLFQM